MSQVPVPLSELRQLAARALENHNTAPANAASVAAALALAEADGQRGHGISRLPAYAGQAASGKVDGHATPSAERVAAASVRIDAGHGFAYPAIDLAIESLPSLASEAGIAVAAINRSHHFGVAGHAAERLAATGLVGLVFGNSPKAIAPWGGRNGIFGTNPIAFAAPRRTEPPLVVDLSLSKVARGKVMVAAQTGDPIPEGWALDAEGRPTTDARAALAGTMVPMGDAKGAALVLMVEVLAAALTSAHFGFEATSFFDAEGDPPGVGQLLLAIDPGPLSTDRFDERLETLIGAILAQDGTRLPGARRFESRQVAERDGVQLQESLYLQVQTLADGAAA